MPISHACVFWPTMHTFKPLAQEPESQRGLKTIFNPTLGTTRATVYSLNFAFQVRSGRLQPGGPDEGSFPPHSFADVHVWIHMYLHTHAFTSPVKSASGVYTPLHLGDITRRQSGCLEKTLQLSINTKAPVMSTPVPQQEHPTPAKQIHLLLWGHSHICPAHGSAYLARYHHELTKNTFSPDAVGNRKQSGTSRKLFSMSTPAPASPLNGAAVQSLSFEMLQAERKQTRHLSYLAIPHKRFDSCPTLTLLIIALPIRCRNSRQRGCFQTQHALTGFIHALLMYRCSLFSPVHCWESTITQIRLYTKSTQ